jgi:hypothetical protein
VIDLGHGCSCAVLALRFPSESSVSSPTFHHLLAWVLSALGRDLPVELRQAAAMPPPSPRIVELDEKEEPQEPPLPAFPFRLVGLTSSVVGSSTAVGAAGSFGASKFDPAAPSAELAEPDAEEVASRLLLLAVTKLTPDDGCAHCDVPFVSHRIEHQF